MSIAVMKYTCILAIPKLRSTVAVIGLRLSCLTPLSTISQLYRRGQLQRKQVIVTERKRAATVLETHNNILSY
jgi:hypothetical protein